MNDDNEFIFIISVLKSSEENNSLSAAPLRRQSQWNKILKLSQQQEIAPLLYAKLTKHPQKNIIPSDIFKKMENIYLTNLFRNTVLWNEFTQIIESADEAEVKILPLKGIILSRTTYPNLALREFADIDVLIQGEDLFKIKEILSKRNYEEIKERDAYLFSKPLIPEVKCFLEIHTMLSPPRPNEIKIPKLWQRLRTVVIDKREFNCLSQEDMFFVLALHIRRHTRMIRLKSIYDISQFLKTNQEKLDWQYIRKISRENHLNNSVYLLLYLSRELFDDATPCGVINYFNPGLLKRKLIHLCINKRNFLSVPFWRGCLLRFLLFDSLKDIFIYVIKIMILRRK